METMPRTRPLDANRHPNRPARLGSSEEQRPDLRMGKSTSRWLEAAAPIRRRNLFFPSSVRKAICLAAAVALLLTPLASAQKLGEFSLERWAKLTETQRYQLQIAEKYMRERNYKVAAAEYEKYLTLYESSEAGAYAQLQWSVCQVEQRQANTAIKDGFQSVIDYWPDSPEAIVAAYRIGSTYKGMGRVGQAKKALLKAAKEHPDHLAAVHALSDLADIANQQKDSKGLQAALRKLVFDVKRTKFSQRICTDASHQLARLQLASGALDEAVKSLGASYEDEFERDSQLAAIVMPVIRSLAQEESQDQADRLVSAAIAHFRAAMPTGANEASRERSLQYWFHIAAAHDAAMHTEETPQVYEQIFKAHGPNDEILRRLADWHKSQDQYDLARSTYRRFADKIEGLSQIAYSYRQQGNVDPAVNAYQQLIAQDNENTIQWKSEIAATYRGAKMYQQAIDLYEALATEDIERADSWRWQVATAYEAWGKYTEAIGHYRQCTNFPENYKRMAGCQRRLKKHGEAIILYNQVMSHEPSAPWALLQIGYTREEAQQKEQAIKTFQLVCKRFPKDRYASVAHAHLQNKYKISVTLGGAKN